MANETEVALKITGDASGGVDALTKTESSAKKMSDGVSASGGAVTKTFDKMTSGATFLTDGLSNVSGAVSTLTNLSRDGAVRADQLARAQVDVTQAAQDLAQALADTTQAQVDLRQAQQDSVQAGLDVEQAMIDAEQAQTDYNDAVAEFGEGSIEARQAQLDLKQATADAEQANIDAAQATADVTQANLDLSQASVDARGATLDLSEAQREAVPPTALQVWTERLEGLSPLLFTALGAAQLFSGGIAGIGTAFTSTLVPMAATSAQFVAQKVAMLAGAVASGVVSAATGVWAAIQWVLNLALLANPITWIVIAVIALIAVIVLIATKTTWFQDLWSWAWGGIKAAAAAVWDWLKGAWDWLGGAFSWLGEQFSAIPGRIGAAFGGLFDIITWPFRTAFNFVSDIWNNTVGRLSWSVPDWVPIIGGNTISVPKLPHFHGGGEVPGPIGQEVLAVLQAGETVTPIGGTPPGGAGRSTTYDITIHNPKPERASESIDSVMSRITFLAPGGAPA